MHFLQRQGLKEILVFFKWISDNPSKMDAFGFWTFKFNFLCHSNFHLSHIVSIIFDLEEELWLLTFLDTFNFCSHLSSKNGPNFSLLIIWSLVAHRFGHVEFGKSNICFDFFKCACLKKTTINIRNWFEFEWWATKDTSLIHFKNI